jgi:hypothetical protein
MDRSGRTVFEGEPDFVALETYERRPDGSEARYAPFTASASYAGASDSTVLNGTCNVSFVLRLDLLPELSVVSFRGPSAGARPGERVLVSLTVRNSGKVPARDFSVEVRIDGRTALVRYVNILDAGQTRNFTFEWPASAGKHSFRAVADPQGAVGEPDRSDDERAFTAEVRPAQELPPMSMTLMLVLFIAAAFAVMVIAWPKT